MEWQPIETAPKDGTQILLGKVGGSMIVGFWNGYAWDDGDFDSNVSWPSHWMPLPEPPK